MSTPQSPNERFRSATEFPPAIAHLSQAESAQLYLEMRDCLIFTNRSRAQLIRRNEEHKQKTLTLKGDVTRLQTIIHQLTLDKQALAQNQQATVTELEQELRAMTGHLDQLSKAFEDVEDVNSAMGVMAIPGRFARFWQALRALIVWWRDEYVDEPTLPQSLEKLSQQAIEEDRRNNPQMYTDPASIQRSERD